MIDGTLIEEIKYRNDIFDIISGYVTLKRSGSGYVGLCPFHSERTPSFHVAADRGFFHCFGCGAGGDVISFIMRIENLDYPSAVEFLAKRAGIQLPENSTRRDETSKTRILDMNKAAAKFFYEQLKKSDEAMKYLSMRGLSGSAIKHFGIGYAPNEFSMLTKYLKTLGYTEKELSDGFLCGKSRNTGKLYDYFRNRIIFPIIDTIGNIIAFGGRIIGDGMPKYLNTSDTPAFKKSRNLFALNFAKQNCSDGFILCEGYMDVVSLHEYGFTQAVATLGTAITPEQARIMKRYTDKVLVSYDNDDAGQKAASRAMKILGDAGLECKILKMSGAKDPDEYIRRFGKDKFKQLCNSSVTPFDYIFANIVSKYDIDRDDMKIKAAEEASSYISTVYSAVERDVYINRTAEKLSIPSETVKADVERKIRSRIKKEKNDNFGERVRNAAGIGDRINPEALTNRAAVSAEEAILGIIMLFPEQIPEIQKKFDISSDDFITSFGRRVYEKIIQIYENGIFNWGALAEFFSTEEMDRLNNIRISRINLKNNGDDVLKECLLKLRSNSSKDKNLEDILNEKRNRNKDKK